jgi:hypothetical protein
MRRPSVLSIVATALLGAWILGCASPTEDRGAAPQTSAEASPGWSPVAVEAMDPGERDQRERALTARNEMLGRLMATLKGELEAHGPAAAISVCRDEAPEIAREVAGKHDLRIGRTSYRLRNPANQPPGWARPYVEKRESDESYLTGPEGELAALLPIRLQSACLPCHGPTDEIPDSVSAALAENYPDDRATGFREGELRGWFWVEVPPR